MHATAGAYAPSPLLGLMGIGSSVRHPPSLLRERIEFTTDAKFVDTVSFKRNRLVRCGCVLLQRGLVLHNGVQDSHSSRNIVRALKNIGTGDDVVMAALRMRDDGRP